MTATDWMSKQLLNSIYGKESYSMNELKKRIMREVLQGNFNIDSVEQYVCEEPVYTITVTSAKYDSPSQTFLNFGRVFHSGIKEGLYGKYHGEIKKVIFNNPATIVYWLDGTKTVVKCQEGDVFSEELGLALCFAKKALGNTGAYYNVFKRYLGKNEKSECESNVELRDDDLKCTLCRENSTNLVGYLLTTGELVDICPSCKILCEEVLKQ